MLFLWFLVVDSVAIYAAGLNPTRLEYSSLTSTLRNGRLPHRCHAVETLEAMQDSGCSPHAAVYSSVIDALWQTGIVWAQAKALQLFNHAVECVLPHVQPRLCIGIAS